MQAEDRVYYLYQALWDCKQALEGNTPAEQVCVYHNLQKPSQEYPTLDLPYGSYSKIEISPL